MAIKQQINRVEKLLNNQKNCYRITFIAPHAKPHRETEAICDELLREHGLANFDTMIITVTNYNNCGVTMLLN